MASRSFAPEEYSMDSPRRGLAIVISMEEKPESSAREGGRIDRLRIVALLKELGFEVTVLVDKSAAVINRTLRTISQSDDLVGTDCFVGVIMSHGTMVGGESIFTAADGERVELKSDVFNCFKATQCEALAGKPKIFFINCCRGGTRMGRTGALADDDAVDEEPIKVKVPTEGDFLVAYSTLPGFVSFRDRSKGTYFISTLVDVMSARPEEDSLHEMLTTVNREIADSHADTSRKAQTMHLDARGIRAAIRWRTVAKTREWAAAKHWQWPLKRHDKEWDDIGGYDMEYAHPCCWCKDPSSTYCCTPSGPTHWLTSPNRFTYNGTGDQTSFDSYTEVDEETAKETAKIAKAAAAAVDRYDGYWAAANHRQVPLEKHHMSYGSGFYRCCGCSDESSTYCCTPSSPTHYLIKGGYTYNGTGDQTSLDSDEYTPCWRT